MTRLFPDSEIYVVGSPESGGIYEREMPNGHRWLQPLARFRIRLPETATESPCLKLRLGGPSWVDTVWIVVRINGAFCATADLHDFHELLLDIPALPNGGADHLDVEIETLSDVSGGPDTRRLAIALYGAEIVSGTKRDSDSDRSESFVLMEQLRVLTGNPPFSALLQRYRGVDGAVGLEVGGGMGVLSGLVAAMTSAQVWCVDMLDYNSASRIPARAELQGMLRRGSRLASSLLGMPVEAAEHAHERVVFHECSAEDIPLRDNYVDFAFSLNAFEHIRDPAKALAELKRTLKPGGAAYLQFSPVFMCDAGSHLYDQGLLDVPWCALLYSRDEIRNMIAELGNPLDRVDEILDSLNELPTQYYRDLFANCGLRVDSYEEISGCVVPGAMESPEFERASARFPAGDLLVQGFKVVLTKPVD